MCEWILHFWLRRREWFQVLLGVGEVRGAEVINVVRELEVVALDEYYYVAGCLCWDYRVAGLGHVHPWVGMGWPWGILSSRIIHGDVVDGCVLVCFLGGGQSGDGASHCGDFLVYFSYLQVNVGEDVGTGGCTVCNGFVDKRFITCQVVAKFFHFFVMLPGLAR